MKKLIAQIPLLTAVIFGSSYASQMYRMWTTKSALGQSVFGWIQVWIALMLFYIYYRQVLPDSPLPRWCVAFESFLVLGIIATIKVFT